MAEHQWQNSHLTLRPYSLVFSLCSAEGCQGTTTTMMKSATTAMNLLGSGKECKFERNEAESSSTRDDLEK